MILYGYKCVRVPHKSNWVYPVLTTKANIIKQRSDLNVQVLIWRKLMQSILA